MIPLLDVGAPQGAITSAHWQELAARGYRGVWARCGNGNDAPDATFAANRDGAKYFGIAAGAYAPGFPLPVDGVHPGRDGTSQALMHFNSCRGLGQNPGELPPALDLEWPPPQDWPAWKITPATIRAWAIDYGHAAGKVWNRKPFLYLYPDYAQRMLVGASPVELAALTDLFRLWLARYETSDPGTLPPWGAPVVWQKSDGGARLPSGAPVDEDVFVGDEDAWDALLAEGSNA